MQNTSENQKPLNSSLLLNLTTHVSNESLEEFFLSYLAQELILDPVNIPSDRDKFEFLMKELKQFEGLKSWFAALKEKKFIRSRHQIQPHFPKKLYLGSH